MSARILVTGSRLLTDSALVMEALTAAVAEFGPDVVVVHGAARGADAIADRAARDLGLKTRVCPRCGRPLAGRDRSAREHAANVRKLVLWVAAFPFTLGVAVTLGVTAAIGALR